MPTVTLFETNGDKEAEEEKKRPSLVSGIVINNCDQIKQGKVLVRIPTLDEEVWARVPSSGAGSNRGIMNIPQPDDEVLVGFADKDPNNAYILGSVWNNNDRIPAESPEELLTKRLIRTGILKLPGHEIEFDDASQSITITTSTDQQIIMKPEKIEITTKQGAAKIVLDTTGKVTIEAKLKIKLEAPDIEIKSQRLQLSSDISTDIKGGANCNINAQLVRIN